MRFKQKDIAEKVGISKSYISQLLSGDRRPAWKMAKRLANCTCTSIELWMEGSPEQIKSAISEASHD